MTGHRVRGLAAMALGILAVLAPFAVGDFTLAFLGLAVTAAGALELVQVVYAPARRVEVSSYAAGVLSILAGLVLLSSPALILAALLTVLALFFLASGITKIGAAVFGAATSSVWGIFNGGVDLALAAILWSQGSSLPIYALGFIIGCHLLSLGWSTFAAEQTSSEKIEGDVADCHPDPRLLLPPHPEIGRRRARAVASEDAREPSDLRWCAVLILIFFAIHVGRTGVEWSLLGLITPLLAVVGDVLSALLLSVVVILPARLLWRRLTRPIERSAWHQRLARGADAPGRPVGELLVDAWLDRRLAFALRLRELRGSLPKALWRTTQMGLPVVALVIAVNPIWGFSWYFNTENWASGFWQEVAGRRTDHWREGMVRAVLEHHGETDPTTPGFFAVHPPRTGGDDFSFLVIGDPGEGDESQHSLRDRFLDLARQPGMRFVVISSDVIYPDGAMRDYEPNFYLPFKGVRQPIYGMPGNHDWFNALGGFNPNFLEPDAARVAMQARERIDFGVDVTQESGIEERIAEAARLRREFGVRTGEQRAPFFELQEDRFALLVVDTGVLRTLDPAEWAWLEAALERSRGKFVMAVLGHPFYAGGHDIGAGDPPFERLHDLLRRYTVPVVMAGDTHDFEYYRELYDTPSGPREMKHFVNGGGGAYLSIGTALDWPAEPATADWAFYPSTGAVRAKLDRETPRWKWPFWAWVRDLGAWPASVEALSGLFDFNHAPFFQSFVEVRVTPTAGAVRFALHGASGPLRWRDLEVGGAVVPDNASPEDAVEFVVPLPAPTAPSPGP
jgi:uncharacterized membrane protein HdeD (DUF308 family)